MSKDDMANLKTPCLPFSFSVSDKNCCKIPILLSNFHRQHFPLCHPHQHCSLRIQVVFHVECFCVEVEHKSGEILHDIVDTSTILKVLEHCVFWQYDKSNHPGTLLSSWDTGCNITFELSNSFCAVQYWFL